MFRAVGLREFESIAKNDAFLPGGNSLSARQFAFTMEEALKYADTDPSKVAIVRAIVAKDVLQHLDFSVTIDPHIFTNGFVTVQPGAQSDIFLDSIESIEIVF